MKLINFLNSSFFKFFTFYSTTIQSAYVKEPERTKQRPTLMIRPFLGDGFHGQISRLRRIDRIANVGASAHVKERTVRLLAAARLSLPVARNRLAIFLETTRREIL